MGSLFQTRIYNNGVLAEKRTNSLNITVPNITLHNIGKYACKAISYTKHNSLYEELFIKVIG